jgi:ppGpp synthetase/RelA/SpoT-type nucleotidyltranferase
MKTFKVKFINPNTNKEEYRFLDIFINNDYDVELQVKTVFETRIASLETFISYKEIKYTYKK